ncbi:hypothetical protein [Crocinitomix catalasitica]|uniref:hypothetical protein n=1 Tax=Crocinitomix catalasitica TaxID=184607 RepID=UPI000487EA21|nr:hypothetical protein [Crocinitomix catalasitica]
MKLENILDRMGSLEKNSFIKIIDGIISNNPKNKKEIEKILIASDKGIKSVDNQNITNIFLLIQDEFTKHIFEAFQEVSSQFDILIDIIIRDGNCIMKQDWFSRLYENEIKSIKIKIKDVKSEIDGEKSELSFNRNRDYKIYYSCLKTAYFNDIEANREAKISSDELSIMLTLSKVLGLSQEDVKLINYTILPIKKLEVLDVINELKNLGVLFFSKKENTVYIADEMVKILRTIRKKEVAPKYYRRTLKVLRDPIINQIARNHSIDRSLDISSKIEMILKQGISFSHLLAFEIHKPDATLTEKKKTLNDLCETSLSLNNLKGSTLEEKIGSLIAHFEEIEQDEKVGISIDGFEKMLVELNVTLPKLNKQLKAIFELQEEFVLKAEFLLDFNIKPRDILDLLTKNDLGVFIKANGIKQRGDDILNILEHYKDVENLYLENYANVGYRNLNGLKENGIIIREAELGLKFEELTKVIFNGLGFNVDESLKNSINTQKDMMDILLNIGNNEVIIVECKSVKEKGYNKFSTVSRQLKSYQNLALKNDLRIVKILLIAPEFSDDFVTDCELDIEMNLTLVKAESLSNIYNAFKSSKYDVFPHILFRDVVVNEERILKALSK